MTDPREPRNIGAIAGGLANDLQALVKGELALASHEFETKLRTALVAMASVIGGALLAFAGLVVLLLGIATVLDEWMPQWVALLVVGLAIIVIGGIVAMIALNRLRPANLKPSRTLDNVGKDARVLQETIA